MTSNHGEITIMISVQQAGTAWDDWLQRARLAEGFKGARKKGKTWLVVVQPATPASEIMKAFFNSRLPGIDDNAQNQR
jgi:hypothetical protein